MQQITEIKAESLAASIQDINPSFAMPDLTVIFVSYNTRELTLAAVRTLLETTHDTSIHCVVLDNASEDGSADAVEEAFPEVEVIRSTDNLGFARANNLVAAQADTEWLLLLNPDTETHDGAVDNLMAFARAHPEGGIYGGRTVFPDGSLNIASCWRRITPWSMLCHALGLVSIFPRSSLFNSEAMGGWQRDSVRQVDIVQGCFFLIRRDLWNELGGFDLRYFMYGEEADLCLRAAEKGYRPMITPEAEIMHILGAASKTRAGKRVMLTRARAGLIRDHWPKWQVPFGLAMMWLWAANRVVATRLLSLLPGRAHKERAALWAEVWAKRGEWLKGY